MMFLVVSQEGEKVVYVEFTLLGGHASDPPDAPSLQEAGETLQTLVDHGELTVSTISHEGSHTCIIMCMYVHVHV